MLRIRLTGIRGASRGASLEWKADRPREPDACEILITGFAEEHPAFVCTTRQIPLEGAFACAQANVIYIHPDLTLDCYDSVMQHEAQHVCQFFEVQDSEARYAAEPLPYELEAAARSIIFCRLDIRNELHLKGLVRDLTGQYGVPERDAERFVADVVRTKSYPGVTSPRR